VAVIACPNCGKSHSQIFKLLNPLKISRMLIYPAIKYCKELWRVEDRARSRCLNSVRAEVTIKPYGSRFVEIRSGNRRSCPESRTYRPTQVVPHHERSTHESSPPLKGTPPLKEIRRTRTKGLLQWHVENEHENILFTDEKIFTVEEQYNNQYNKIYAQTSLEVRSKGVGGHQPS